MWCWTSTINMKFNLLGFVLHHIILWIYIISLIRLTPFMTCSITYACHRILWFPIWNHFPFICRPVLFLFARLHLFSFDDDDQLTRQIPFKINNSRQKKHVYVQAFEDWFNIPFHSFIHSFILIAMVKTFFSGDWQNYC